jgi:hypothetical protein
MKRMSSRVVKSLGSLVILMALALLIVPPAKSVQAGCPCDCLLTPHEMGRIFGDVPWMLEAVP